MAASVSRSSWKADMIWWKPRFCSPSTASAATRQSDRMTSRVSEACQPILRSGWPTDRPGLPASTMNVVMPRCPSGEVRAATTSTSAIPALVMNILVPSRRKPPSTGSPGW